jgi:wyosine [tRNA(Phe)-imidazoG37] synthetase (radical SAM superfamily)
MSPGKRLIENMAEYRSRTGAKSLIYGPVPSWRLGRSLGIDLLSTEGKTCSFDCIYCQLGRTAHPLTERREFVSLTQLREELEAVRDVAADYATFSGVGEPTLASNLGDAIALVKSILPLPVAVLTNASLMVRQDVRGALGSADAVVAKVDAPDEDLFRQINRPYAEYPLDDIINALTLFRKEYNGKLALQVMFVQANKERAPQLAQIAARLCPDEVQINTPLRPCAVPPLPPEDISAIGQAFSGFQRIVTVYEAPKPSVIPLNQEETALRRPEPRKTPEN